MIIFFYLFQSRDCFLFLVINLIVTENYSLIIIYNTSFSFFFLLGWDTLKWRKSNITTLSLAVTTLTLLSYMPYFISWPSLTSVNLAPDFAAIFAILTLILVPLIAKPGPTHLFKLICILLLSVGLYHILRCKVRLLYCFLLNCFIFPLDPLPLLAAFKDIHFNTIPDFIVFGESLLIDTISLVSILQNFMCMFVCVYI